MKTIRLIGLVAICSFVTITASGCAVANFKLPEIHEVRGVQIRVTEAHVAHGIFYEIHGYIRNVEDVPIRTISIAFPVYDAGGNLIAEALANLWTGIEPGGTWRFKAVTVPAVAKSSYTKMKIGKAKIVYLRF